MHALIPFLKASFFRIDECSSQQGCVLTNQVFKMLYGEPIQTQLCKVERFSLALLHKQCRAVAEICNLFAMKFVKNCFRKVSSGNNYRNDLYGE